MRPPEPDDGLEEFLLRCLMACLWSGAIVIWAYAIWLIFWRH